MIDLRCKNPAQTAADIEDAAILSQRNPLRCVVDNPPVWRCSTVASSGVRFCGSCPNTVRTASIRASVQWFWTSPVTFSHRP
jgi:hypothetical protein